MTPLLRTVTSGLNPQFMGSAGRTDGSSPGFAISAKPNQLKTRTL